MGRRQFIQSAAGTTALSLLPQTSPASAATPPAPTTAPRESEATVRVAPDARPEVLLYVRGDQDQASLRSMISQMLEQGIWFEFDSEQNLPTAWPASLERYQVVLMDAPAAAEIAGEPQKMQQLEDFARRGGVVFRIPHVGNIEQPLGYGETSHRALLVDVVSFSAVQQVLGSAPLTVPHPGLRDLQLRRGSATLYSVLRDRIHKFVSETQRWNEFSLHYFKSAICLASRRNDQAMRGALIEGIGRICRTMPDGYDGNEVAGLFATAWLAAETGERGPLGQAVQVLERVLAKRPRPMGVLAFAGFTDDPLGRRGREEGKTGVAIGSDQAMWQKANWNESLHFHCSPLMAIGRTAKRPEFEEEAIRLIEHCGRHNVDAEGLLFHVTRNGSPVSERWSRGQTHALYGMVYTLDELGDGDPRRQPICELVRRIVTALLPYQDAWTGLWRNVVNQPVARLESSATSAITYVMARGVREGWLARKTFEPAIRRAWAGLKCMYWQGGLASQCRGTLVGNQAYYLSRPQGWGIVPQLAMTMVEVEDMGPESG